jgi:hypothetical protein
MWEDIMKFLKTFWGIMLIFGMTVMNSCSKDKEMPTGIEYSDELIAFYPFNGNANDESGYNHHGTVNGATLAIDRFGNSNSAYDFDGNSNYIKVPHNSSFNSTNGLTVSLWAKPEPVRSRWRTMIAKGRNIDDYDLWTVQLNSGMNGIEGAINFYNGFDDYPGSNAIDDGSWHHIVLAYDGNVKWQTYVDTTVAVTVFDNNCYNNDNLFIGAFENNDGSIIDVFDGTIDDVRIYNYALTNSEIIALFHEGGKK